MPQPIWNQRIFYELLCYFARGRRWLDLGCGRGPRSPELQQVRPRAAETVYVGIDLDMDSLKDSSEQNRIRARVESLPFPNGSFDLVTSNMVFEHVDDPITAIKEANRVLDGQGALIIHTASSLHYTLLVGRLLSPVLPRQTYGRLVSRFTGREIRDIFPTRYRANTTRRLLRAVSEAGFTAGFITHLETPLLGGGWIGSIEERLRRFLPRSLKGTILAVYIKKQ